MKNSAKSSNSYVVGRMFTAFFAGVVGVVFLLILERLVNRGNTALTGLMIINMLPFFGAAVFAAGLVLFIERRRRKVSEKELVVTGGLFMGIGVVIAAAGLALQNFFPDAFGLFYVFIPALTILYLIYYIYQKEYFFSSVLIICGCFGFYFLYRLTRSLGVTAVPRTLVIVAALVLLAIAALLEFAFRRPGGKLRLGSKEYRPFPERFEYRFLFITLALLFLGLFVTLFLGFHGAYYMMFVMLVLEFVYAVYFTARLI